MSRTFRAKSGHAFWRKPEFSDRASHAVPATWKHVPDVLAKYWEADGVVRHNYLRGPSKSVTHTRRRAEERAEATRIMKDPSHEFLTSERRYCGFGYRHL